MNDPEPIATMPVQTPGRVNGRRGRTPKPIYMRAYEVYSHVYGPQEALITGECRGGLSTGELIAFLYAASFPKNEWRARVDEAFRGATDL